MARNKTIYEDSGMRVIQKEDVKVEVQAEAMATPMSVNDTSTIVEQTTIKIKTSELFDTFVSYMKEPFAVMPMSTKEKGKCALCGVETSLKLRVVCPECMSTNRTKLYDNLSENLASELIEFELLL